MDVLHNDAEKDFDMGKVTLVLVGFIIFSVLFGLGNTVDTAGNLARLLFTAFGAIFIMVLAISIAPWIHDKGY
jgi:hypothetical protein